MQSSAMTFQKIAPKGMHTFDICGYPFLTGYPSPGTSKASFLKKTIMRSAFWRALLKGHRMLCWLACLSTGVGSSLGVMDKAKNEASRGKPGIFKKLRLADCWVGQLANRLASTVQDRVNLALEFDFHNH